MRKIMKKPVIVVGLFLLLVSLVFLLGYVTDLPYFRDSELGWIWTTMIAGIVTLFFGYFHDFLEKKKARSKVR
ncbi:hypothetical protein EDX87_09145 [Listeria monocytogenes]|uniref:hypothetical protein n=1 Tax=Listeria monocytogenes TaxID=1639 RepID=UPI000854E1E2|nr:hypothetical protein [Listeria monocytogenes]EAD0692860.1 hypothetical protein [Listeria monocytogenes]EAD7602674.1 hypothetical protein [Listeria monocytogenes]EAF1797610.1 hypothetical protein [Listeria monocytogenes]EAH4076053.1 hypothetical protein [Listeria monocytogenes]EAK9791059.1 hypothetical protein [Listeria monocytogenes]